MGRLNEWELHFFFFAHHIDHHQHCVSAILKHFIGRRVNVQVDVFADRGHNPIDSYFRCRMFHSCYAGKQFISDNGGQ